MPALVLLASLLALAAASAASVRVPAQRWRRRQRAPMHQLVALAAARAPPRSASVWQPNRRRQTRVRGKLSRQLLTVVAMVVTHLRGPLRHRRQRLVRSSPLALAALSSG